MAREQSTSDTDGAKPALYVLLTEDFLAAAFDGEPLGRNGLRALCRAQTQPVEPGSVTPIETQQAGKACMEEIWADWLEAYQKDPDLPVRQAEREREIAETLSGQLLTEIMSLANLMTSGSAFTGSGACLRTFLTVCDAPRIHSGALSVCFDRHLAQKALKEAIGKINLSDTPLMRLPFPVARSKEPYRIQKLLKTYQYVFVLPFRTKKAREEFLKEWDSRLESETSLLRLPAVEEITWERDDPDEKIYRTWRHAGFGRAVQIVEKGRPSASLTVSLRPGPRPA